MVGLSYVGPVIAAVEFSFSNSNNNNTGLVMCML